MYKSNKRLNVKLITLTIVFLSTLILLPINTCLSEPKTWENLVERKDRYFEKFKNTPFNGKIEIYWPNGHLKETGIIKNSNLLTFFDQNGNSNVENWMHELRKIASKNQPVIILCRSGKRSGIVSNILSEKMQYSKVYNANSGILGWINSGQKTTMEGLSNEN